MSISDFAISENITTETTNKIKQFKTNITELFKYSTAHGYHNIFLTDNIFLKIMWTLFTCTSITICASAIISNIFDFLQYNVVTKVNIINETPITFPAVTICNLNGFSSTSASELVNSIALSLSHSNESNNSNFGIDRLRNVFEIKASLLEDSAKKELGMQIANSLISCVFNYLPCTIDDFQWYYSSRYGNCFRINGGFNSSGDAVKLRTANQPGFDSGLTIELFKGIFFNLIFE